MKKVLLLAIFSPLLIGSTIAADLFNVRSYDFDAKKFSYRIINKGTHLARIEKDLLMVNIIPALDCFRRLSSTSIFKDIGYAQMASTLFFRGYHSGNEVVYFIKMDNTGSPGVSYFKAYNAKGKDELVVKNGPINYLFRRSQDREYVVSFIPPKEYFANFRDKKSEESVKIDFTNLDFLKSLGFWIVYKAQNLVEEYKWDDEVFSKDKEFLIQDHVLKETKACLFLGKNLGQSFKKDLSKSINLLAQTVENLTKKSSQMAKKSNSKDSPSNKKNK